MPRYKNNNICQACYLVESSQLMELAGVPRWSPVAPVPASVPAGCGNYAFARPQISEETTTMPAQRSSTGGCAWPGGRGYGLHYLVSELPCR